MWSVWMDFVHPLYFPKGLYESQIYDISFLFVVAADSLYKAMCTNKNGIAHCCEINSIEQTGQREWAMSQSQQEPFSYHVQLKGGIINQIMCSYYVNINSNKAIITKMVVFWDNTTRLKKKVNKVFILRDAPLYLLDWSSFKGEVHSKIK